MGICNYIQAYKSFNIKAYNDLIHSVLMATGKWKSNSKKGK